jgi:hypothetical protein
MTPEIKERVKQALRLTWDAIGDDVLRISVEMGEGSTVDRDTVIEMILDANRPEMFGQDREAIAEFDKLSYKEQVQIAKEVFTASVYSW